MIEIDGSHQSGSGTIVRYAVALAALRGQPLHLFRARARRKRPGLRSQHVSSVRACAQMCGAKTEGLTVGSDEFRFICGGRIRGGDYVWDIGTAGSATMLALSILPLACFADSPVSARITGGVFQDFAPSPYHTQHVLGPLLRHMGCAVEMRVIRPGYVPGGAGVIELKVQRTDRDRLRALTMTEQGSLSAVSGIAVASHLEERRVSERMARVCEDHLIKKGVQPSIERWDDSAAIHRGAALAIWGESSTGCFFGSDRAGALGRSSEAIGRFVANNFLADLATGATVDRYAADQLVIFAGLAHGVSSYVAPRPTEHLESNLWLVRQFGAKTEVKDRQVAVAGIGL